MVIVQAVIGLIILILLPKLLGIVSIKETQVGIVIKKFSSKNLPPDRLIALNGEAGIQADVLAPGWHFFYFPWQYSIKKDRVINISEGYIGLIVAKDGKAFNPNQILGRSVECDNFQNARKFLESGGQKGKQLGMLTAGMYRINTELFEVLHEDSDEYRVTYINADSIGIVNVLEGMPIPEGEIAAEIIPGHSNFQDAEEFLKANGCRGLQQQVLLPGSWNINPWFAIIEKCPMTTIPIGFVGVVNSFCGKEHKDISGIDFKHGELVEQGHKGIWVTPLTPGKYPLNPKTMELELVPTTNIVLNWAENRTEAHNLDSRLSSITVRSKDGFSFNLDVSQIIHISYESASKVISRVGSMQNLIDQVLEPTVGTYFRNSVQENTVLEFLNKRSERQKEAKKYIDEAIKVYDVECVDTLIGDIAAPENLLKPLTDRKIAEEQEITYSTQMRAEKTRQELVKQKSLADIQTELVKSEQSVAIEAKQAEALIKKKEGEAQSIKLLGAAEAEAIKVKGEAQAEVYQKNVAAVGQDNFARIKNVEELSKSGIQIVPNILVNGNGSGSGSLSDGLLGLVIDRMTTPEKVTK